MSDPGKAARPMSMALSAALESSSSERDLMVKEILVSEAAYVANLDKLIAVRAPHYHQRNTVVIHFLSFRVLHIADAPLTQASIMHTPALYLSSVFHVSLSLHLCSVRTR